MVATASTTGAKAGFAESATRTTVSGKRVVMYSLRSPVVGSTLPSARPVVSVERICGPRSYSLAAAEPPASIGTKRSRLMPPAVATPHLSVEGSPPAEALPKRV